MDEIKNKKILIVDDEKELLKLLENKLFESGFIISLNQKTAEMLCKLPKNKTIPFRT